MEKTKINSLDIAKFIMAIFVICLHTHPLRGFEPLPLFEIITNIAVPFFFIASAYLLFDKFYNANKDLTIILNYIKKMVKLYLIWNIIYLPISIYGYMFSDSGGVLRNIISYIRNFFLKGEHYYSWPLWFLLAIIYSALFVFFYYKIFKNKVKEYHILILSIIIFIIANFFTYIVTNIDKMTGILYYAANLIKLTISNGRLLTGFMYFSIGMCIAKYKIKINSKKAFIMMLIMLILSYIFKFEIFNVILYLSVFLFVLSIRLKDNEIYRMFRKSSTVMYFTHMIFFFIYTLIVGKENCYGLIGFSFTLICTLVLSYIVLKVDKQNNKLVKELFY